MVVVLKPDVCRHQADELVNSLEEYNVKADVSEISDCTVICLLGNTDKIDCESLELHPCVERVIKFCEPFKKVNRKLHPEDTVINVRGEQIGGRKIAVIAGPCSVENSEQISEVARGIKNSGASFLRGGAFKPRTSPYSFQGLGFPGLELLKQAREKFGLPIVTEIMSCKYVDVFERDVDLIQVGARNMQNFDLLKELGGCTKPVLLKRGMASTIEETLMSAEYIVAHGNPNVIICERGIRTFETCLRNTLDLGAVPVIKKLSHLPVVVDPSHAAGVSWIVPTMAKMAIVSGADGLLIEVHNNPEKALCDGRQSLSVSQFASLFSELRKYAELENRSI